MNDAAKIITYCFLKLNDFSCRVIYHSFHSFFIYTVFYFVYFSISYLTNTRLLYIPRRFDISFSSFLVEKHDPRDIFLYLRNNHRLR